MTVEAVPIRCPFCGSIKVEPMNSHGLYYHVECKKCGATGPGFSLRKTHQEMDAKAAAIAAWNKRAP